MEPFLSDADLEGLEEQSLEERIEALAELERTLHAELEDARSDHVYPGDAHPADRDATGSGPAGDEPGA